jgi:hypothetical protein
MAKEVPCGKGLVTLVDDEDYPLACMYKWATSDDGYVFHRVYHGTTHSKIYLHRLIMRPKGHQIVDHINRIKNDNRRSNLRITSLSNNSQNAYRKTKVSSMFIGVCFDKKADKFRADIRFKGKRFGLGFYIDPIDAAAAYDVKALELFGKDALTNERLLKEMLEKIMKSKYPSKNGNTGKF